MAHRNFARGDAPPPNSWEWAGVAKPPSVSGKNAPKPAPRANANGTPVAVFAVSETVVLKKKRSWLGYLVAGAAGFLLGYKSGSY